MARTRSLEATSEDESFDYRLLKIIKTSNKKAEVDKALVALWKQYKPAIVKARNQLKEMTAHYANPLDSDVFEDYVDESYETFYKAVSTMELKRIQHIKGTWTFYICLSGYLQAHNRTIITDHLRRCENETPERTFIDSTGDELSIFDMAQSNGKDNSPWGELITSEESNILQTAIDHSYANFTELQKDIWQMRLNGLNKTEVSDRLNLSSADVARNFKQMRKMIKSEIMEYSARSRVTNLEWSLK